MNKGLLKENRILYTEINRLKKQTQGAMPSKADKKS